MKKHQFRKGIYSYKRKSGRVKQEDEIAIAVHPYFYPVKGPFKGYTERFDKFVFEYDKPLIIMEEYEWFDGTIQVIQQIGRLKDRYFVKTDEEDPRPTEISWQDLYNFIREFDPKVVNLVGGKLKPHGKKKEDRGCLGFTQHMLENEGFNTKYLEGLTFRSSQTIY